MKYFQIHLSPGNKDRIIQTDSQVKEPIRGASYIPTPEGLRKKEAFLNLLRSVSQFIINCVNPMSHAKREPKQRGGADSNRSFRRPPPLRSGQNLSQKMLAHSRRNSLRLNFLVFLCFSVFTFLILGFEILGFEILAFGFVCLVFDNFRVSEFWL